MEAANERLNKLLAMLNRTPADAFLLYAIGLEYKKLQDYQQAIAYLDRALQTDANYIVAHMQKGQVYTEMHDREQAKQAYKEGMRAAAAKGDNHARQEMAAALMMLET